MKTKPSAIIVLLLLAAILMTASLLSAGCAKKDIASENDSATNPATINEDITDEVSEELDRRIESIMIKINEMRSTFFADSPGYTYSGTPAVPAYRVEPGLANIENIIQFTTGYDGDDGYGGYWKATTLSDEAFKLIEKNGFAVSDKENWTEYFAVYELNRYKHVPSFITTDSAVHTFFLMFDYVLRDLEQQHLYGELIELSNKMVAASDVQYQVLKGTEFENAALRNVAFFSVGSTLLDPGFAAPGYVQDLAYHQELALIEAHSDIAPSPLINLGSSPADITELYQADYTQFITRGHYTLTPELEAYFKAMMWYGQMTFRSAYEDEVKSALLQMFTLLDGQIGAHWQKIFEPTNFFVGECDDITWYQYYEALQDIYGKSIGELKALTDAAMFEKALAKIREMAPPQINSIPVFNVDIQPDIVSAITGYRFLGQRFTIDGAIMQRLMDRETPQRMLPKALDIPAAFGSQEAYAIIEAEGDMRLYPDYAANMAKVRNYVESVDNQAWQSNLYWSWLNMLRPLAGAKAGGGMPLFMQNDAWTRKQLNTFIGSWTELKYSAILYAKPPMAEMGDGGGPEPPDDRGYVEPNPEVFGRLAALVQMLLDGLGQRDLLTETARESLGVLKALSDGLTSISEKELANQPLTGFEYDFIRNYGGELEHIWEIAKKDEMQDLPAWYFYLEEHPGAVVVDIATDPNGQVLQEATGFAKEIYVAFPRDGQVVLSRGVVYSHYEFTVPLEKRMMVDAWHKQILEGKMPPVADWQKAFLVDLDYEAEYFYPNNRI
jgi:hypothetical protein